MKPRRSQFPGKPAGKAKASAARGGTPRATLPEVARKLLEGLNPEQRAAAMAPPGPVLVLAGAGSGKTRVLITRIVHLLASGTARPGEVAALTFSNRAAREMQQRLRIYAGQAADGAGIGTFHSLGLRLVREHAQALGLGPDPGMMDTHSRLSLLMSQAGKQGARNQKLDPMELLAVISNLKDKGVAPEDCPEDTAFGTKLKRIYKGYEKLKRQGNLVDFEDLIRMPIALLRERPEIRSGLAERWKHFLVDEFQDTNQAQLELLRLLVGGTRSVFVVGDDDQSIYGWRGAEMRNLLDFEAHFPGAVLHKLQQNYRSTGTIIEASNAVIHRNTLRRHKVVFTAREAGDPLFHHVADDEKGEVDWLLERLKEANRDEKLDWKEMALLVRTNIHLREWMEHFIVNGIPFSVKGVGNLLEWPEVQAVLAYAKLMANPEDELSLSKVLQFPKRGFPRDLLEKVPRSEAPLAACLRAYCAEREDAWSPKVVELLDQVEAAARDVRAGAFCAPLIAVLASTGVLDSFEAGGRKRGRVDEFLRLFQAEEKRNPEARLAEMLSVLALDTQSGDDPEDKPGVRLMTVHAAKGLEFHTVFLPTLDDDVFPSKPNHTDTGIEEERRLFYVAMTRAKRRLFLSWPATKVHYRVVKDVIPSRFLFEIPETHWDGPLGKKDKEGKREFLDGFFASLNASLEA